MTKAEILIELKKAGQFDSSRKTPLWEIAFTLYNTANNSKLRPSCGGCFNKVRNWLRS